MHLYIKNTIGLVVESIALRHTHIHHTHTDADTQAHTHTCLKWIHEDATSATAIAAYLPSTQREPIARRCEEAVHWGVCVSVGCVRIPDLRGTGLTASWNHPHRRPAPEGSERPSTFREHQPDGLDDVTAHVVLCRQIREIY